MTKSSGDSAQLQYIQIYLALHTQLDNDIYGHILNDIRFQILNENTLFFSKALWDELLIACCIC